MDKIKSHHPYAAVTIFFWSLSYVYTRLCLRVLSPAALGFLRYLMASAFLLVIACCTKMPKPDKKALPWLALSGASGFALYMIAFNQGQVTVTAATASVVIATVPVITALLARVFYGEKLRLYQWAAIGVEFAGVGVLTLMNGVLSVNAGLLWLFGAAVLLSIYNVVQRRLTKTMTALQATTYSIFFGTLMLSVFAFQAVPQIRNAPKVTLAYLAVLGIGSSALAYVCWSKAFSLAKRTAQVSNYMFITPFLTSLLAFLIAGEMLELPTLLGGGIILLGVTLFNFGNHIFINPCKQAE